MIIKISDMKLILSVLLASPFSFSAQATNHNFVLFGGTQHTYGIHLSMNMSIHRYQTVAEFNFSSTAENPQSETLQTQIANDRAKHPGRNYILNPIKKNSDNELFFKIENFVTAFEFDASILACDTPVIWNTCFETEKTIFKRTHVTVKQVFVNFELVDGAAPLNPAQYQIISDGESSFAFPLMTDLDKQFDQVLYLKLDPSLKTSTFISSSTGQAKRLAPGDILKSKDGATTLEVASEILFIDNMP